MKLLFFGTPEMAVPFLDACARHHSVIAVVTRPDKPVGRGLRVQPPPVKSAAQRLGLSVLQPQRPGLAAGELRALGADMAVVVAYGHILKADVLSSSRLGFMNVHFSLLPKYRGAAPVAWSLIRGEHKGGVTLFWIDEGMDTGPIQLARETEISPDEDAVSLMDRLVLMGVEAMKEALTEISQGIIRREFQSGEPSLAPKLSREDALLDFSLPAEAVHNRVRGLRGGPKAFFRLKSDIIVLRTILESRDAGQGPPGLVVCVERDRGILIQCNPGRLWIVEVQPEGKRQIPAADFINGLRFGPGDSLSS